MYFINQITPFTCGLACIESVATDAGFPISQTQMLIKYKDWLIADASEGKSFGATSLSMMKKIWGDLGFYGEWIKNHNVEDVRDNVFKKLQPKQGILISSNFQKTAMHCIRYFGLKDEDTIFAIVPVFNQPYPLQMGISLRSLVEWDFEYAVISR